MSRFQSEDKDAIREIVQGEIRNIGSLFTVAQPSPIGLATPTGFGLVETEYSEGAPVVANAASYQRKATAADIPNNSAGPSFISLGLGIALKAGNYYEFELQLFVSNTGAVGGGINVKFVPLGGMTLAAGSYGQRGTNATGAADAKSSNTNLSATPSLPAVCLFDTSGGGCTEVHIIGGVLPATADGTLDVQFQNAIALQNWIVKSGSYFRTWRH